MAAKPDQFAEVILATSRAEFMRYGFEGTDVSRIARLCGIGTTTFYRLFSDKTDVFLAIYRDWESNEQHAMRRLLCGRGSIASLVDAFVERYRCHTPFRRSLRRLGHDEPRVRQAVGASRRARLRQIRNWRGSSLEADSGELAAQLILFEGLLTALSEADLTEMGADDGRVRQLLGEILSNWRFEDMSDGRGATTAIKGTLE